MPKKRRINGHMVYTYDSHKRRAEKGGKIQKTTIKLSQSTKLVIELLQSYVMFCCLSCEGERI